MPRRYFKLNSGRDSTGSNLFRRVLEVQAALRHEVWAQFAEQPPELVLFFPASIAQAVPNLDSFAVGYKKAVAAELGPIVQVQD